jgi:hypothetical protein
MLEVIDTNLDRTTHLADGRAADGIPAGLDDIPPGAVLAAWLSSIDVEKLSGYDRIVVLRAHQRMATHYTAHTYRDMAAVTNVLRDEFGERFGESELAAEAEIRTALTWTRRLTESELSLALDLHERLPRVFGLLETGAIDVRKARVIVDGTIHLSEMAAQAVVDQILDEAPALTTGQLRARVRKLCITTDPDDAKSRYEQANESRRVVMQPTIDGTAHLFAFDLPPDGVAAATKRINRLARAAKTEDDQRTPDQIRADVYIDLLCGRDVATSRSGSPAAPSGRRTQGTVDIRVDLTTLSGLNDDPGHLAGYGPVIADIARKVAASRHDAEWRYTIVEPGTGRAIASGTTRRRPSAAQRRAVEALNPTCVFPGCRAPAADSDIDHRRDWAKGGPTTVGNLNPLCKHDHRVKHEAGWSYRVTEDGTAEWTSRLGHTYTTALPPP